MRVDLTLFGPLREKLGQDKVELDLDPGATVRDALQALGEVFPNAGCLDPKSGKPLVMAALRGETVAPDAPLADGDRLELISPMAGG